MGKKIILIQNDKNLRDSTALILKRAGYSVTARDSINNAYDNLRSGEYHLAISDNNLPKLKELLHPAVIGNGSQLPILIVSDHFSPDYASADQQFDITYLDQPNSPEDLLDCIRKILGSRNFR